MAKPVYKMLDEKGRVLIPLDMRQKAEMEKGDIVKVALSSGRIVISKVDIVESGKTLEENGLGVLEEVCQLSARLIVNKVSMKMKKQILPMIEKVKAVIE